MTTVTSVQQCDVGECNGPALPSESHPGEQPWPALQGGQLALQGLVIHTGLSETIALW